MKSAGKCKPMFSALALQAVAMQGRMWLERLRGVKLLSKLCLPEGKNVF